MKLFCHILAQRLTSYSEKENLVPDFQFAYRKRRSPISAASLLHNIIDSRLNRKNKKALRTYVAFIDFRKCFDSVNRE